MSNFRQNILTDDEIPFRGEVIVEHRAGSPEREQQAARMTLVSSRRFTCYFLGGQARNSRIPRSSSRQSSLGFARRKTLLAGARVPAVLPQAGLRETKQSPQQPQQGACVAAFSTSCKRKAYSARVEFKRKWWGLNVNVRRPGAMVSSEAGFCLISLHRRGVLARVDLPICFDTADAGTESGWVKVRLGEAVGARVLVP